jgi:hypothetical protein
MMPNRPVVMAFDGIETLFALEPLADRLRAVGLPAERAGSSARISGSYRSCRHPMYRGKRC